MGIHGSFTDVHVLPKPAHADSDVGRQHRRPQVARQPRGGFEVAAIGARVGGEHQSGRIACPMRVPKQRRRRLSNRSTHSPKIEPVRCFPEQLALRPHRGAQQLALSGSAVTPPSQVSMP